MNLVSSLPINGGHWRPISRNDSFASAGKTATNNEDGGFFERSKRQEIQIQYVCTNDETSLHFEA